MTSADLARHQNYKTYLLARERRARELERGFRSRLAEAMTVQNAFVSQVLNGSAHLSFEQGLAAASYLGLDGMDQEYFVTLIELARAGTVELKRYVQRKLALLRAAMQDLRQNLTDADRLGEEQRVTYYGHWAYAAVHVLVTIPEYQTPPFIATALGLREAEVKVILRFLHEAGLITITAGRARATNVHLHLERGSRPSAQHHAQWRMKVIDHLARSGAAGVHYTTVSSLSEKDELELKSRMIALISEYTEVVKASAEERLCAFNLDFYRLA